MLTAPRKPTHDTNSLSRIENRNGSSVRNTAAGRATNIRTSATRSAGNAFSISRLGQASRPSSTNMAICASQVAASRNATRELCARVALFPTRSPAI